MSFHEMLWDNGQITLTFDKGQYKQNLPVGHTFTIPQLNIKYYYHQIL
jgi:hypothetical protein